MNTTKKSAFTRLSILGFLALGLTALSLTGCFDSGTNGKNSDPCADDASLCIPRALLRDTGEAVYQANCTGCHGSEGQGERAPQVRNSSFIMENRDLAIMLVLRGNAGTPATVDSVYVNGVLYLAGGMPGWSEFLTDYEIAAALTFIRSVWNDTLVTNCDPDSVDANNFPICDRTPRDSVAMDLDSVAVWEVKAARANMAPFDP